MKKWLKILLIILGISLLFTLIIVIAFWIRAIIPSDLENSHNLTNCSEPISLVCIQKGAGNIISKAEIPCDSDTDCHSESTKEYCGEGNFPSIHSCIGERNYCGEDGFCKQCQCRLE